MPDFARPFSGRGLFAAFLALSVPFAAPALAEPQVAVAPASAEQSVPWLYEGAEIPIDRSWTFGELDNGLRYAVKHNAAPPDQVSIRIAVDVGSLYERPSELGYAHLLEHLSFRESEYVPDGEAKRIWQRFGATFGSDTNAQTSTTQTVYKLDLPDVTREKLDESMKILSGMMSKPIFTKPGVEAEKQIVLAEKRERDGPFSEMVDEANSLFYRGQRIAERPVIGTEATLRAATPASVRAFHDRWYRPENIVISIAGDVDPALLQQMIETHFSDWSAQGKPASAPDFGDPVAGGPDVKLLVQPNTPTRLYWTITRPWRPVRDTFAYNEQNIVDAIALKVISRRLERFARQGASFLAASVSTDKVSRSADITQMAIRPEGEDWRAALSDARAFVADALATPPSKAEVDREVSEYLASAEQMVAGYPSESAADAADSIVLAVDIRETVATPMVVQQLIREAAPRITPERVFESTKELFNGDTSRLLMISPAPVDGGETALAAAFHAPLDASAAVRVVQKDVGVDDLPNLGPPGEIATEDNYRDRKIVTFDNKVKAFLMPRSSEDGSIRVLVRFGTGYQGFAPDKPNLLWSGDFGLISAGVGDLGIDELDQLAVGRQINIGFGIDYDAFELSGETQPSDLEAELRLLAGKLEAPRWDTAPLEREKRSFISSYAVTNTSPDMVLSRELQGLMSKGDTRFVSPAPEDVAALDGKKFRDFWEPILKQGPVEVMLVGDFDMASATEALKRTFGALDERKPAQIATKGKQVAFAGSGGGPVVRYHDGQANQAAALIAWPGGAGRGDYREERVSEILGQIFSDRLIEEFRGLDGASYSPQAYNFWPENMESGGYFMAYSLVQPDKVPLFYDRVQKIAEDLTQKPVSADELSRAVVPQEQWVLRYSTANGFWVSQFEGATTDLAERQAALVSLIEDYATITPADIQAAAQKYLQAEKAWRFEVLPRPAGE